MFERNAEGRLTTSQRNRIIEVLSLMIFVERLKAQNNRYIALLSRYLHNEIMLWKLQLITLAKFYSPIYYDLL